MYLYRPHKPQDKRREDLTGQDQIELNLMNPDDSGDAARGQRPPVESGGANDWKLPKYRSSNHTIHLMVCISLA